MISWKMYKMCIRLGIQSIFDSQQSFIDKVVAMIKTQMFSFCFTLFSRPLFGIHLIYTQHRLLLNMQSPRSPKLKELFRLLYFFNPFECSKSNFLLNSLGELSCDLWIGFSIFWPENSPCITYFCCIPIL